jgi:hypothetical protein
MIMRLPLTIAAVLAFAGPALAAPPDAPSNDAKKLSEIVATVEKRDNFAFIDEIDFDSGVYEIVYFMKDGAEVKLQLDARTGEPPVNQGR